MTNKTTLFTILFTLPILAAWEDCENAKTEVPLDSAYTCDTGFYVDADADGTPACLDCDDADATTYDRATETCDGIDNDCNDIVDDYAYGATECFSFNVSTEVCTSVGWYCAGMSPESLTGCPSDTTDLSECQAKRGAPELSEPAEVAKK